MRGRSRGATALGTGLVVALTGLVVGSAAQPAGAEHATGHRAPTGPAPVRFADDFVPPTDAEYGWPLGGFGGVRRGAPLRHVPIVFVHGNQADAQNYDVVRDQLRAELGYSDQELWALSYGGLGYVGGSAPIENDGGEAAYVREHPQAGISGNPQNNEVNVPDLVAFVDAVRAYTGAQHVSIVAHSLGVTLVRRAIRVEPRLREHIAAVVAIAGANHGTSVCTGLEDRYYGCDELAPGSAWLERMNADGEGLPPTRWMTIYDGSGVGDAFYAPPEADSPRLAGAEANLTFPNTSHNDLRVDPAIVRVYGAWLLSVETDLAAVTAPPVDAPGDTTGPGPRPTDRDGGLPATGGGAVALGAVVLASAFRLLRPR